MAPICSQVSSATDFHRIKSPKLDEAAETKDSSKSAIRSETGTGFDDDSSDDEFGALSPQEVEELDGLCDFALSLCETQHVSSVTESDHRKPKLDDGDKDEAAETKDSLKSAKRWETGAGFDDESSDDFGYNDEPAETNDTSKSAIQGETGTIFDGNSSDEDMGLMPFPLEIGEVVELSDFALSLYETQHPGDCWKFESLHGGYRWDEWLVSTDHYHLEFFGKKADCKSIRNFVVDVICCRFGAHEKLTVHQCVLLKDDEVEPMDENIKEKVSMETGRIFQLSHEELQKDYEKIVEFCKSALTYYEELHSGEAYEFVEIQTARRSIIRGIFIFHAKKKGDATLATFKAYTHHRVLRTDIDVLGSFTQCRCRRL
nr:uncharacterized protein LOC109176274 isoform X2 [Ipomoea batatas]